MIQQNTMHKETTLCFNEVLPAGVRLDPWWNPVRRQKDRWRRGKARRICSSWSCWLGKRGFEGRGKGKGVALSVIYSGVTSDHSHGLRWGEENSRRPLEEYYRVVVLVVFWGLSEAIGEWSRRIWDDRRGASREERKNEKT